MTKALPVFLRPARFLLLTWLMVGLLSVFYHKDKANVITWDNYGYYLYLPAFLKYGDWDTFAFVQEHHKNYPISSGIYQIQTSPVEKTVPTYLYGMSVLYLPFYLMADGMAKCASFPDDALSPPYQWALIAGAWFYGLLALWLLFKVLASFWSINIVWLSLLVFLGSTQFAYYTIAYPASPHVYLFFAYAALLWATVRYFEKPDRIFSAVIGLIVGILCLSRPSEWVSVLIPLGFAFSKKVRIKEHILNGLLAVVVVLCMAIPQMVLWKYSTGQWIYNPYPFEPDWLNPHIIDGLFSYRKGWLVYTPVMVLAILGMFLKEFRKGVWFWPVVLFFLFNLYMVFTWPMWWYTSSFGMRALIQSYPVMLLPFTAFLHQIQDSSKGSRFVAYGLLFLLSALNVFQTWQYEKRIIPLDGTTKKYYWKVFGKTERDKMLYRFMDLESEMPARLESVCDFSDSYICSPDENGAIPLVGKSGLNCDRSREYCHTLQLTCGPYESKPPKTLWIVVSGEYAMLSDRFGEWEQAKMVVSMDHGDSTVYWKGVRLQPLTEVNTWTPFRFEYEINDPWEGAVVKAYLWNNGPDTLLLREMKMGMCSD
jgi:hypothetical protein